MASAIRRAVPVLVASLGWLLAGCGDGAEEPPPEGADAVPGEAETAPGPESAPSPGPGDGGAEGAGAEVPDESGYIGPVGEAGEAAAAGNLAARDEEEIDPDAPWVETPADRRILRETVSWARDQGLEQLPVGEIMGLVGSTFVGVPYRESPLESAGEERLVVDLRGMDCVTFVEQVLAIGHVVRQAPEEELEDDEALAERFREALRRIRYRGGEIDGYPSRLHYFSDWIRDNEAKGFVEDLTRSMGGTRDERPVGFMSSNPDLYRQLREEPELVDGIRRIEERLSGEERFFIPQEEIARRADRIRTGDVIAATSTVEGLDVAHTGIALWHGGRLHLLHAPLADGTVEISPRPLAERILEIEDQDGILVARPRDADGTGTQSGGTDGAFGR